MKDAAEVYSQAKTALGDWETTERAATKAAMNATQNADWKIWGNAWGSHTVKSYWESCLFSYPNDT